MNSSHLKVCAAKWMPWINVMKLNETDEIDIKGPMADILILLARLVGFRYKVLLPPDGQWGVKSSDGNWSGMVGMVQRKKCDMILGPLASTYERNLVVTYTAPPFITYLGILGGSTFGSNSDNLFGYFSVFQKSVWLMLLVFICVISGLTLFGNTVYDITKSNIQITSLARKLWDSRVQFWIYFFEFLGTLLCESTPEMPRANSSRVVLATWWMGVIVLMNTFGGMLKASMLMQDNGDKIDSIQDLVSRPEINVYVWKGTAYEALIKESPSPEFQKIWEKVERVNGTLKLGRDRGQLFSMEQMKNIQLANRVIISDLPTMKYTVSNYCDQLPGGEFHIAKQEFFGHTLGMAVRKDFNDPLLRQINKRIRWLVESQLVDRWVSAQYGDLESCVSRAATSDHKMLGLSDLAAIFYLWILCLGISTLSILMEYAINIYRQKKLPTCLDYEFSFQCRHRDKKKRLRKYHSIVLKNPKLIYKLTTPNTPGRKPKVLTLSMH